MNKINNNYHFFKSAVDFFFLFFLHGTSIGTRQQGISYNGSQPYDSRVASKKNKQGNPIA